MSAKAIIFRPSSRSSDLPYPLIGQASLMRGFFVCDAGIASVILLITIFKVRKTSREVILHDVQNQIQA